MTGAGFRTRLRAHSPNIPEARVTYLAQARGGILPTMPAIPSNGRIYLRHDDGLIALRESPYDAEELLQSLVADYPDLLAGEQMDPVEPRRWLLIDREVGIEDAPDAASRWSLDHLFVDQDGTPTLIEVKRSSDTRIRREVAGQMLDYAANLSRHWAADEIRRRFEMRCERERIDSHAAVVAMRLPGTAPDTVSADVVDAFWAEVAERLVARRLRLLFVADVIPMELQAIIEFLNEGLTHIEVLGVEVKQYVGEGRQTIVPRVIGRTAAADGVKRTAGSRPTYTWAASDFRAAAYESSPEAGRLVDAALAWLDRSGIPVDIGRGQGGPLYLPAKAADGRWIRIASISSAGRVELTIVSAKEVPPFDRPEARVELLRSFEQALDTSLPVDVAVRATWTSVATSQVAGSGRLERLFAVIEAASRRMRAGE